MNRIEIIVTLDRDHGLIRRQAHRVARTLQRVVEQLVIIKDTSKLDDLVKSQNSPI
jgi:hypothetical protein